MINPDDFSGQGVIVVLTKYLLNAFCDLSFQCPEVNVYYLFPLAAPTDLRKILDDYIALMDVSQEDPSMIEIYIKQKINLDFDEDNWRKKHIPDHLANVILVHGKNDDVITIDECLSLAKEWGLNETQHVRLIDDVGHYNILKSSVAIEEIFSKINQA